MFGNRKPKKTTARTIPIVQHAAGPSSASAGVGAAHPKTSPKKQAVDKEGLIAKLERIIKLERHPIRNYILNLIKTGGEAHRSIAMFMYGYVDEPEVALRDQLDAANREDAYRFQNPGDDLGRVWYADEGSGRTIEMFYKGWADEFDRYQQDANAEMLKVMRYLNDAPDEESHNAFKKLALDKLRENKEEIGSLKERNKSLLNYLEAAQHQADLYKNSYAKLSTRYDEFRERYDASQQEHDGIVRDLKEAREKLVKLRQEKDLCMERIPRLEGIIEHGMRELETHGTKYMVDLRLRALLQHWGITNLANVDPKKWQKYDTSNAFAMEHTKLLDQILNGISKPAGNVLIRSIPTIGLTQSMRVASIHRIVHGADLLADCRIVALRLVKGRHDQEKSTEVGLLPKDVATRQEDNTFTSVFTPPATTTATTVTTATASTQKPGAGQTTTTAVPSQISVTAPEVDDANGWKWAQFDAQWRNWDPTKSTMESTWQGLFDATVLQLYNLDRVSCQNILVALTAPPETQAAPERQARYKAEREVLLSHAAFISKWVTITEMVHHYASRALRLSNANPALWQHWRGRWFRLRKAMTMQTFGEHLKLSPGKAYKNNPAPNDPWSRRRKRGLFHDYVGLFGQVCKLFNRPSLVDDAEWDRQLKLLDWERWNLYRHAVQTWVHRDAYGGQNQAQYDNNNRPLNPVAANLWTEYNWIYETDKWKYAHRADPKKPAEASEELWDPLPATEAFKDFSPTIKKFHVPGQERGAQIRPESIVPGHIEPPPNSTGPKPLNLTWRNYWMKQKPEQWEDFVKDGMGMKD